MGNEDPGKLSRRDLLKGIAGGAAAAAGLGASAEAQTVRRSVEEKNEVDIFDSQPGFSDTYRLAYESWLTGLSLITNRTVKGEVDAIRKFPLGSKEFSVLTFTAGDKSLPPNLEIIQGNGESIEMRITRGPDSPQGADVIVTCETYVPKGHAEVYKARGIRVVETDPARDRLLRVSIIHNPRRLDYKLSK